jgi:L-asparagine transporter-like permease
VTWLALILGALAGYFVGWHRGVSWTKNQIVELLATGKESAPRRLPLARKDR